jgi:hypothetical protein
MSAAVAVPAEIIKTVAAGMFLIAPSHAKEIKKWVHDARLAVGGNRFGAFVKVFCGSVLPLCRSGPMGSPTRRPPVSQERASGILGERLQDVAG